MPKLKAKPKMFGTEAALCAAFIAQIGESWTAFNETAGWDILLVRRADGFQIGVQAKLRLNAAVVGQALEDDPTWSVDAPGPDCRAVLVPADIQNACAFDKICAHLGVTVVRVRAGDGRRHPSFGPSLPIDPKNPHEGHWHELAPLRRHGLPEYVPDVAAGSSSPLQLTAWKIKAIKIAVTLETRGHVTRRDFAHHKLDHRRWLAMGWLKVVDGQFVKDLFPDFERQHPVVYGQIRADAPKWLPRTVLDGGAEAGRML